MHVYAAWQSKAQDYGLGNADVQRPLLRHVIEGSVEVKELSAGLIGLGVAGLFRLSSHLSHQSLSSARFRLHSLYRMEAQSWVCGDCRQKTARTFCLCKPEETFLCEDCLQRHIAKNPGFHPSLPVQAYGQHRKPGYSDRLQARSRSLEQGKEEAMRSLQGVEECIRQLNAAVEAHINELRIWTARKTGDLYVQKAEMEKDITEAIEAAKATLYMDELAAGNSLVQLLRSYAPGVSLRDLFKYKLRSEALSGNLTDFLQTSFNSPKSAYLPYLSLTYSTRFNCSSKAWDRFTQLRPTLMISADTQYFRLDEERLFLCGGLGGSRKAYIVQADGTWKETMDMSTGRSSPGVVLYERGERGIYVFGGYSKEKSGEKFMLKDSVWEQLAGMESCRSYFTPVCVAADIYLVGGYSCTAERYNPSSNSYFRLSVSIPEATGSVAMASGALLTLFTANYYMRYKIQENGDLTESTEKRLPGTYEPYLGCGLALDNIGFLSKEGVTVWVDLTTSERLGIAVLPS